MQNLKITIIQPDIIWENPKGNLEKYSQLIDNIENTDVIILPEMFTTGFSMHPENLKESMDGISVNWMKKVAANKNASVVGSLIIEENKQIFNRALWVFPNGKMEKYDKRHLYTMGQEHLHYSPGKDKLIVEFRGWKFCPLICYDLRFPHLYRGLAHAGAGLFSIPAAFTKPTGGAHWHVLMRARAIENACFVISPAQCGHHGEGRLTYGHSLIVDPWGDVLADGGDEPGIVVAEIDMAKVEEARGKIPSLRHDREYRAE